MGVGSPNQGRMALAELAGANFFSRRHPGV
jgi:hypothetical protein